LPDRSAFSWCGFSGAKRSSELPETREVMAGEPTVLSLFSDISAAILTVLTPYNVFSSDFQILLHTVIFFLSV
jgi:hypothetical protein